MRYTILKGQTYSSLNFKLFTILTICSFLLVFSFPALAKPDKVPKPEISQVSLDDTGTIPVLEIIGSNFDYPEVSLGILGTLTVEAWGPEFVVVEVPGVEFGDYKLTVRQGPNGKKKADFDLTIGGAGGVGPQGEKGDKGDTGDTGPTGPAGSGGGGGVTGFEIMWGEHTVQSNTNVQQFTTLFCPVGKIAISAGAGPSIPTPVPTLPPVNPPTGAHMNLAYLHPKITSTGVRNWIVGVDNQTGTSKIWKSYTVCVTGE